MVSQLKLDIAFFMLFKWNYNAIEGTLENNF